MYVLQHRNKAVEMSLVTAGYSLAAIRGERWVAHTQERPQGAAAVLGSVQQRTGTLAGTCVLALGILAALETGLLAVLLASVAAALALHLAAGYEPTTEELRHEVQRPGMTHQEVLDRAVQYKEFQKMKQEAAEDAAPSGPPQGVR